MKMASLDIQCALLRHSDEDAVASRECLVERVFRLIDVTQALTQALASSVM
jgi:hypothetical protein